MDSSIPKTTGTLHNPLESENDIQSLGITSEIYCFCMVSIYLFFSSYGKVVHVPSLLSILKSLNCDRGTASSRKNDRCLRQFFVNRHGLVQAGLVQWLGFEVVIYQRKKRSLVSGRVHSEQKFLPEPSWKTLHHSSNKGRNKVLIC